MADLALFAQISRRRGGRDQPAETFSGRTGWSQRSPSRQPRPRSRALRAGDALAQTGPLGGRADLPREIKRHFDFRQGL